MFFSFITSKKRVASLHKIPINITMTIKTTDSQLKSTFSTKHNTKIDDSDNDTIRIPLVVATPIAITDPTTPAATLFTKTEGEEENITEVSPGGLMKRKKNQFASKFLAKVGSVLKRTKKNNNKEPRNEISNFSELKMRAPTKEAIISAEKTILKAARAKDMKPEEEPKYTDPETESKTEPKPVKKENEYTLEEVAEHTSCESCWIIIGNSTNGGPKVYDVTKYINDHPGGTEVLLDVAGQDADEFFEDIGHSAEARSDLKTCYIGNLCMDEEKTKANKVASAQQEINSVHSSRSLLPAQTPWIMLIGGAILAVVAGVYLNQ